MKNNKDKTAITRPVVAHYESFLQGMYVFSTLVRSINKHVGLELVASRVMVMTVHEIACNKRWHSNKLSTFYAQRIYIHSQIHTYNRER